MKDSPWTHLTTGFWPSTTRTVWPLVRARLQRSKLPILVGPFRGEVGFEALYWVPFVRKLGIDPARLIPITRGGAHCWYPATRGVELFALREPRQMRVENTRVQLKTGMLKQFTVTPFDAQLLRDAAQQLGLTRYLVLHPKWMYQLLTPFWDTQRGFKWLHRHVEWTPLPPPPLPDGLSLPEQFLTARFYDRATWPRSETTTAIGKAILLQMAAQMPVIVLNSGVHADEHTDHAVPNHPNLITINGLTPQNNLAVQSAILARSQGFVGTYGGFAQLALMYKKPTISLYLDWKQTALMHRHVADYLGLQFGVPTYTLRATDVSLLHSALPKLTLASPGSSGSIGKSPVDMSAPAHATV